jgi:hypothetical protein
MTDGWLYVENDETGGTAWIPDDDGVRAWNEARGWRVVAPPEDVPFVPPKVNIDPDEVEPEFVELVHPETQARHQWPNNPAALAGAADAGWVTPNKDGSVPKRAKASAAKSSDSDGKSLAAEKSNDRPAEGAATNQKE